jgi:hypothetical protein
MPYIKFVLRSTRKDGKKCFHHKTYDMPDMNGRTL